MERPLTLAHILKGMWVAFVFLSLDSWALPVASRQSLNESTSLIEKVVEGGRLADEKFPLLKSIVRLETSANSNADPTKKSIYNCTGTLISPTHVLTAAHCLMDKATKEPLDQTTVHFYSTPTKYRDRIDSRSIAIYPDYLKLYRAGDLNRFDRDIAVVTLRRPAPKWSQVAALPEAPAKFRLHDAIYFAGYGDTRNSRSYARIQSTATGLALEASNEGLFQKPALISSLNQAFSYRRISFWSLHRLVQLEDKCLSASPNGIEIKLVDCLISDSHQHFYFSFISKDENQSYYQIQTRSGKCLQAPTNGSRIQVSDCQNLKAEIFSEVTEERKAEAGPQYLKVGRLKFEADYGRLVTATRSGAMLGGGDSGSPSFVYVSDGVPQIWGVNIAIKPLDFISGSTAPFESNVILRIDPYLPWIQGVMKGQH